MYATNPAVSRDVQLKTFIPESQTLRYSLCCIVAPAQQRVVRERAWSTVQRLPTVLAQYGRCGSAAHRYMVHPPLTSFAVARIVRYRLWLVFCAKHAAVPFSSSLLPSAQRLPPICTWVAGALCLDQRDVRSQSGCPPGAVSRQAAITLHQVWASICAFVCCGLLRAVKGEDGANSMRCTRPHGPLPAHSARGHTDTHAAVCDRQVRRY